MLCATAWASNSQVVSLFKFERIGQGEPFKSSAHADAIIVLDFFAPWCVPCVGATRKIDEEVKDFYTRQSHEVPVIVVAVNIDQGRPRLITRFLENAGLETGFNDVDGALFDILEGEGVPFIVVLTPEGADRSRRVYFQQTGLNDTSDLKEAIDGLRKRSLPVPKTKDGTVSAADGEISTLGAKPSYSVVQRLDNAAEYMVTDDVRLFANDLQWELQRGRLRLTNLLSYGHIEVDYKPAARAFFGEREERVEDHWSYSVTTAWVEDQNTASLTAGFSDGFQDYRSVWLAEYYQQGFENDPAYSEPDPHATFVAGEWASLLVNDQVRVSVNSSYRSDDVAPPYERIIPTAVGQPIYTQVGREHLETVGFGGAVDWIATERTRVEASLSTDDTTGRELRWTGEFTVAHALTDSWVASLSGTHVSEGGEFDAWSVAGMLDYDWYESWFLGVLVRYYEDNGLVWDSTIVSAESPPLDSWQVGIRLAKVFERASFSFAVFHYRSMYDSVSASSFEYENLYCDRRWLQMRLACSLQF